MPRLASTNLQPEVVQELRSLHPPVASGKPEFSYRLNDTILQHVLDEDLTYCLLLSCSLCAVEGLIGRDVKQLSESLGLSERAVRKLRRQVALECLPPRLADAACQDQDDAPLSAFESAAARYRHSVRQGGRLDSGCHRYAISV
jgi:hypothetical protein